ncbi:MAG: hypothetical protein EZS28_042941 [Streblomastix strix]|uniref:Uncharacterized protein n=1 Tax=Streblomastix strix TaxID=222440 RepID=A0A5J4TUA7_9EUKA|nr:MAG: hypothetical protein EZS28_042941 [Streblomastix strix]
MSEMQKDSQIDKPLDDIIQEIYQRSPRRRRFGQSREGLSKFTRRKNQANRGIRLGRIRVFAIQGAPRRPFNTARNFGGRGFLRNGSQFIHREVRRELATLISNIQPVQQRRMILTTGGRFQRNPASKVAQTRPRRMIVQSPHTQCADQVNTQVRQIGRVRSQTRHYMVDSFAKQLKRHTPSNVAQKASLVLEIKRKKVGKCSYISRQQPKRIIKMVSKSSIAFIITRFIFRMVSRKR